MYFYTKEQKAVNAQSGEKEVSCITVACEDMESAEKQLYYDAWYAIDQKANFDFFIGAITNELGNTEKLIHKDWRLLEESTDSNEPDGEQEAE